MKEEVVLTVGRKDLYSDRKDIKDVTVRDLAPLHVPSRSRLRADKIVFVDDNGSTKTLKGND